MCFFLRSSPFYPNCPGGSLEGSPSRPLRLSAHRNPFPPLLHNGFRTVAFVLLIAPLWAGVGSGAAFTTWSSAHNSESPSFLTQEFGFCFGHFSLIDPSRYREAWRCGGASNVPSSPNKYVSYLIPWYQVTQTWEREARGYPLQFVVSSCSLRHVLGEDGAFTESAAVLSIQSRSHSGLIKGF